MNRSFPKHLDKWCFLIFSLLHSFSDYYFILIIFRFAYEGENQRRLINVWRSKNIKKQHLSKCVGNDWFSHWKYLLKNINNAPFSFYWFLHILTYTSFRLGLQFNELETISDEFLAKFKPIWVPEMAQTNKKRKSYEIFLTKSRKSILGNFPVVLSKYKRKGTHLKTKFYTEKHYKVIIFFEECFFM